MNNQFFEESGFDDFSRMIEELARQTSEGAVLDAIEEAAKAFTNDLLHLPKPKSRISKPGYTHLINTFSSQRKEKEIEVGWGKYYGTMVEKGTSRMKQQPHLRDAYDRNRSKYERLIINKILN